MALEVIDQGPDGADWLGAIRGGFGNPLKTLRSQRTVSGQVAPAFRGGLAARGLAATGAEAPFRPAVTMLRFNANLYPSRAATADFSATLTDAGGRSLRDDQARTEKSEMTLASGILEVPQDLAALANEVPSPAERRIPDNSALRLALRR